MKRVLWWTWTWATWLPLQGLGKLSMHTSLWEAALAGPPPSNEWWRWRCVAWTMSAKSRQLRLCSQWRPLRLPGGFTTSPHFPLPNPAASIFPQYSACQIPCQWTSGEVGGTVEDVVPYTLTGDGQGARPPKSEVADRCGEKPGMITGFNTSSNEFHKSSSLGE